MAADGNTKPPKKLSLKENYALLTRDLGWEPSYQKKEDVFRMLQFEGIKIHDWDKWEDPFRLTMDAYWKYQGEKEKKLYAIIDAFQQGNGQFNVTDARYPQALKVFINGVIELEYRLLALLATMMDYLLPKRVMSWAEAWEIYYEQNGGALFADLARYGIRPPKYADVTIAEKVRVSHEMWSVFYANRHAVGFPVWLGVRRRRRCKGDSTQRRKGRKGEKRF